MTTPAARAAFFDIGNTLGTPHFAAGSNQLEALDVYPYVPGVLEDLRARRIRLGIISNKGSNSAATVRRVLQAAGIYDFLDPRLILYGAKDDPRIFRLAAGRAGHAASPDRCLFIGENPAERAVALAAGFRVAADPRLAWGALQ